MPNNRSANQRANVLIGIDGGIGPTSEHFGFGRDPATNASTGPRVINVAIDPNGAVSAPAGSVALANDGSGPGINTTGADVWTDTGAGGGTAIKTPCRVGTTAAEADITLAGGAPDTVDGVLVAVGDRVLVKNQVTAGPTGPQTNGIYVVDVVGTGADGTWTRALDMDTGSEITGTTLVGVQEGTPYPGGNEDTFWFVTTDGVIVIGVTDIFWSIYPTLDIVGPTTFVYRPGEPVPAGNVYADFTLLYAALSMMEGPRAILFDDSLVSPAMIPAGAYDFSGVTALGLSQVPTQTAVSFDVGAQASAFFDVSRNIVFDSIGVVAAVLLTAAQNTLEVVFCEFSASGLGSFFEADGVVLTVLSRQTEWNDGGGGGALTALNGGAIRLNLYERSRLGDTLDTDATGTITVRYDRTTPVIVTDAGQTRVVVGQASFRFLDLGATFVYRPTEPNPAFNVYADFGLLMGDLSAVEGPRILQFDNSLVSPAPCAVLSGVYDFESVQLQGLGCGLPDFPTPVSFAVGTVITNLCSAVSLLDLQFNNTVSPVISLSDGLAHALNLDDISSFTNLGTEPVIDVGAATSLTLTCENGSGLFDDPGVSTDPIVRVSAATGTLFTALYNGSYTDVNTLSSVAGATVGTTYDATSYTQTQAGVSAATWTRAALDAPPLRRVVVAAGVLNPNTDGTLSCDTSAALGIINITLPALTANIVADGEEFTIKNEDGAFDVTLSPTGGSTVDEVAGVFSLASLGAGRISVTLVACLATNNWLLI